MSETNKPRPETPLDVESLFCDALQMKPDKVESYFEFVDWPDKLGARFKRYLPTGFNKLMALVREWGGEYDSDRRQFVIPKPTAKEAPTEPSPTPSQGIMGYYAIKPGYYPNFPIDKILSSKFSFRLNIGETIEELMAEIHVAGRIIVPLICRVTRKPGYVEVGPGERRLLAARNLGMKTVPIIVDKFNDQEFDRIRLLENLAREDLTDYEMALVLEYMLKKHSDVYPTQQALADDIGKSREWVANHLRMLQLGNIVSRETIEKITEGQAREILAAPPDKRKEVAEYIETTGEIPPMREIKKFVHPETEPTTPPEPRRREVPETKPEPLLTGFEIECPECQAKLLIDHREFPDGSTDHKLKELPSR